MSKNKTPLDKFAKLLENPSHNLSVEVYTEDKDGRKPVNKPKKKYTLNQLGMTVDKLGSRVDQLGMTVDKLVLIVNDLAKQMNAGFKQVNARIDQIDARLDYIVKANDLKDLSNK